MQAIVRIARIYKLESQAREMTAQARLAHRKHYARPLWNELHAWLKLERTRVPDGGGIAAALDYSLKRWEVLGRFLDDAAVSVVNNHIESELDDMTQHNATLVEQSAAAADSLRAQAQRLSAAMSAL